MRDGGPTAGREHGGRRWFERVGWWRPRSVRARSAMGATAVVAVALIVAGLAVLDQLRGHLTEQADLQAEIAAREVASSLATGVPPDQLDLDDDYPVQVLDERGRLRAVSEDLEAVTGTHTDRVRPYAAAGRGSPVERAAGRASPLGATSPVARGAAFPRDDDADDDADGDVDGDSADDDADDESDDRDDQPRRGEVSDDGAKYTDGTATVDGERAAYRFAKVRASTPAGEVVTVYAGAPLATEQQAVRTVRRAMLLGLPVLLLVVASVTWLVTRRSLGPVEGIRREMAAITASTDLSRRVPEPRAGDEVGRLARTTNQTLAALDTSVERQRRFVADASHELRNPLASLRTQLEVGAAHPELLDLPGAVQDVTRLQALAADLLLLARLDAGERPTRAPVVLAELLGEELAGRAAGRVPVRAEELAGVRVAGSRAQLARVLANLLDNAQRHAAEQVLVAVREERAEGRRYASLTVADDGSGVPVGERERIFERFVRLDDARSRDEGGAGLGLAIARDVVARHGGSLRVEAAASGGALFEVRLPAWRGQGSRRRGDRWVLAAARRLGAAHRG